MQRVRRGDLVQVISGADRGRRGRVLRVDPARQRVMVEGIRVQTRHRKPSRPTAPGTVTREAFVHWSNVMLVDPRDDRPSRVRIVDLDGHRRRVFVRSGEPVPDPAPR